jgi:cellulose synthase/poly-beta-1,6-N-acetylglucosamine synthase-like glycosyltransferase
MWLQHVLIGIYLFILLSLAVYGFHRTILVWLYYRNKKNRPEPENYYSREDLPKVTIQLPVFNELNVVERLIQRVAELEYPADKLEIQVLDDSTDETQGLCRKKVDQLRNQGCNIHYIHRDDRTGYKAGALENGLKQATGELVMVFDADFMPERDTLASMVHYFTSPKVGMVQARWGHSNRDYSKLTEVEAIMLDGHFAIEHTARHRSGRFFNFNGTAGIWRVKTIEDAGGWEHDTLTEDMDLSYRAQLKGWKFVYLFDTVSPAELPMEMNSFKSQQFRWAKGSIQVAMKLLPTILRSKAPFAVKAEAIFHLTNNFAYPLLLLLSIFLLPNLLVRTQHGWREVLLLDLPLFFGTTMSVISFYTVALREVRPKGWYNHLKYLPLMLSVGIGLCINQTRAVFEALLGKTTEFVRTPKHGVNSKSEDWRKKRYRAVRDMVPFFEIGMGLYFAVTLVVAFIGGHFISMPFLCLFLVGYLYVGSLSVYQRR